MQNRVFAVLGQDHELMAGVAADRSALGLDGQVVQPATLEDAAIGGIHGLVALVQSFQGGVEAVGVLHEEFAGAQHAEPRPLFVAELGLDLIHRDRHLPVAGNLMRDQVGDRLFVRRPQGHVDLAVLPLDLELDEHVAEGVDPPALFEETDRREGRHEQFHRPGGVHPLADDLLGLLQGPQAQRQVGIRPGHDLVDQSGAEHEDMAGDFRPFGRFFHRGDQRAGPEHGKEGVRDIWKHAF